MATMYDCTNRSSREVYEEIRKYYEEAYQCIDKALKLDESGKTEEAIGMYEFSLTLLDQALGLPLESPTEPDVEWEKAYSMIQKMRKSRKEVLIRISDAQNKQHPDAAVPPPSYEEAMLSGPSTSAAAPGFAAPMSSGTPPVAVFQVNGPYQPPVPIQPYIPQSASIDTNLHNNPTPGFSDLNAQLSEMRVTGNREIIYSHNNVRLYFIAPDGRVSSTSAPDTLIIGRIEDLTHGDILDDTLLSIVDQLSAEQSSERRHKKHHGHGRHGHHGHHGSHHRRHGHGRHRHGDSAHQGLQGSGQVYLQVGSWVYPLIPGISPVFRSDYGAFILPDVHSELEGAAVGLILPATADQSVYDLLSSILLGIVGQQDLPSKEPKAPSRSKRSGDRTDRKPESAFASNIVRGASYLANNLVRGAGSASRFLDAAAPRLMNQMNPAAEPQPVNPTLKATVGVAKTVSGKAATVTDYLSGKVGSASAALGQYLAPHIQRGGTRLLTSTTSMTPEEASSRVGSLLGVTAGAVEGIATVYRGLESSAGILGRSLSNNTVQIIEYKYGQPAGQVTGDAMSTAGNLYHVHGAYSMLKPKSMAKTVAKSAVRSSLTEHSHGEFQGPGPGDGGGFGPRLSAGAGGAGDPRLEPARPTPVAVVPPTAGVQSLPTAHTQGLNPPPYPGGIWGHSLPSTRNSESLYPNETAATSSAVEKK